MMLNQQNVPGMFVAGIMFAIWVLIAVVHIAFALAVLRDAEALRRQASEPFLVGAAIWALATLLGGVFAAAAYWVIHYSTLRHKPLAGPEVVETV